MNILLFAASFRKESLNKKLIHCIHSLVKKTSQHQFTVIEFDELSMPLYDADLESASGLPNGAQKMIQLIQKNDALIIATPEYNGSIPGTLKNAIDWSSRAKPNPWIAKEVLLVSASPGALGGVRGLWHSRVPFESLSAHVYPDMFGLSSAHTAFDEDNSLRDVKTQERLTSLVHGFLTHASSKK